MREYYKRKFFYDSLTRLCDKHRMYMDHVFRLFNGASMAFVEYCKGYYMTTYDLRIRFCKTNLMIIEDYQNIVCENAIKALLNDYDKEDKSHAGKR